MKQLAHVTKQIKKYLKQSMTIKNSTMKNVEETFCAQNVKQLYCFRQPSKEQTKDH